MKLTRTLATLAPGLFLSVVSPVAAEVATLAFDLAPAGLTGVPNLHAAVLDGKLYFSGRIDNGALDLWVYDGVNPPAMVPGGADLVPEFVTAWQDAIYFLGGPSTDRELWRYDGVTPAAEALDLMLPTGSSQPKQITAFGEELCFSANLGGTIGTELVCWDGVTAPDVYDIRTGALDSDPEALTVVGDRLLFAAFADGVGNEPHSREAFSAPILVGDLRAADSSSNPDSFVSIGAQLYFRASDDSGQGRVWVDDGVSPPARVSDTFDVEGGIAVFDGRLLADGYDEEDEQPQQMHVLRAGDLVPAPWPYGSIFGASGFLAHRDALYFRANSTVAGDLFRHCGGGIVERVTDQFADDSSLASPPIEFQGRIYFVANVTGTGRELWSIDPWTATFCDGVEDGHHDDWSSSVP